MMSQLQKIVGFAEREIPYTPNVMSLLLYPHFSPSAFMKKYDFYDITDIPIAFSLA